MALNRCSFFSNTLHQKSSFNIIIPNDFRSSNKDYEVVWLLHGLGGDCDDFLNYSKISILAKENPAIYIMPSGGRSFYQNMESGYKYYDYIVYELPKIIWENYGIKINEHVQNIIGVSMGGYGAMKFALDGVAKFKTIISISGSLDIVSRDKVKRENENFTKYEWNLIFGDKLKTEFDLFARDISEYSGEIILICGTKDHLYEHNCKFANFLDENKVDFQFIELENEKHEWACFSKALDATIKLIGSNNAENC